jgi:small subunit ribosomal protein S20
MPITSSAKKALRQNKRRKVNNAIKKDAYRKALKTFKQAAVEKKTDEAKGLLSALYKNLDKAAKTNTISKNKASRLKSRAAKFAAKTG